MSILEVKNLKKNFGSLEVLKGIDFSLEKGEALAMLRSSRGLLPSPEKREKPSR